MNKYRFKTREEFRKEFGDQWMRKVEHIWVEPMNKFFGREIPDKTGERVLKNGYSLYEDWTISKDMIKPIDPDYINIINIEKQGNTITASWLGTKATAKCNPTDEFDLKKGMSIALARLARKLGEYEAEEEQTVIVKKKVKHNILDEI